MADDSLTDETRSHQSKMHRFSQHPRIGCDVLAMTKSYFNLHISQKEAEKLARLRAAGNRMTQILDIAAAHEWRLLSEELDSFFAHIKAIDEEKRKD